MNPNGHERVVKKVSRACNTCRLKRKKCDGLDPCAFCIENKLECLYSKEPRRRGPPSGYLRNIETRVAVLEILLGLYLSRLPKYPDTSNDPFLETAKILQKESTFCTQDVWDAHKAVWSGCETVKIVEELVISFAPFTPRSPQDAPAKSLLPPPPPMSANMDPSTYLQGGRESVKTAEEETESSTRSPFSPGLRPESSERTPDRLTVSTTASPPSIKKVASDPGSSKTLGRHEWSGNHDQNVHTAHQTASEATVSNPAQLSFLKDQNQNYEGSLSRQSNEMGMDPLTGLNMALGLRTSNHYTGSYWRTAELAQPESDPYLPQAPTATSQPNAAFFPTPDLIDLPPPHIIRRLLDVYYEHSYASYPLLPGRATVDAMASSSIKPETTSLLILSLCAYCGRLSLSTNSASDSMGEGLAGKIAADLWYERARTILSSLLKKGISLELVQAVLFLTLRDYGKGNEAQACILVGLAVRMSQSLRINEDSGTTKSGQKPPEELQLHRNVWGVCTLLDLLLSLQLGLPPITADALKISYDTPSRLQSPQMEINPSPPFTYVVSLCRVISMIHFHLYLDYPSPSASSSSDKLLQLKTELDSWHRSLPIQYRIALEQQPRRDVIEINMLYHVAIILLYRPISREHLNQQTTNIFLEAASTFNVLLDKYRFSQPSVSSPPNTVQALSHTNPNIIYLIYTVAIAHLSGYKCRRLQQGSGSNLVTQTIALQTQVHLLKCLEALASIGYTWELSRRCWKALDSLMEIENLKPQGGEAAREVGPGTLGKRKRELTEDVQKRPWPVIDTAGIDLSIQRSSFDRQSLTSYGAELTSPTLSIHTPNSSTSVQYAPYPSIPEDISNLVTSEWNTSANAVYNVHSTSEFPSNTDDMFDPSIFSTKWMPDASRPSTTEWSNTWDESLWSQNFMKGMGSF